MKKKKTRLIFTALAVALSLGSFQMEAAKSAVRKRFDDSLDRFKKCLKRDCTGTEKLKVARDLIAAIGVVVGGAILTGKGTGMLIRRGLPSPEAMGIYSTSGSAADGGGDDEPEAPADEDRDSSSDEAGGVSMTV